MHKQMAGAHARADDAAGRLGDHSEVDKGFAAAAGVPFSTPEDFFGGPGGPPALRRVAAAAAAAAEALQGLPSLGAALAAMTSTTTRPPSSTMT